MAQKEQALKELHKLELQHKETQLKLQRQENENTAKNEELTRLKAERDKLTRENESLLRNLDEKHSK